MITFRQTRWILVRGTLLLAGIACGLLLAELLLRVVGIAYPQPYLADPDVGSRLQPGFRAWFTQEGRALVEVNEAGFRDRAHAIRKPPGTVRIAVLGDSFAEAVQVPIEETFWSVLADELQRRGAFDGRRVEVLNFGISGHGTAQQLQMLRHHVWQYEPDIVLLAFFAGNDVRNNSRRLEPDPVRPFFVLDHDQLVLDDSFRKHPDYLKANSNWVRWKVRAINASRVLQLVQHLRRRAARSDGAAAGAFEPGLDDRVYTPPSDDAWREAWDVTDRLLVELQREVEAHDARLIVALVTQAVQVHPDPEVPAAFAARLGVADLDYPQRRLEALGREHGFAVIPLAEPLADYAQENSVFLHGFPNSGLGTGHWNAAGHRQAGQRIADELLKTPALDPE